MRDSSGSPVALNEKLKACKHREKVLPAVASKTINAFHKKIYSKTNGLSLSYITVKSYNPLDFANRAIFFLSITYWC